MFNANKFKLGLFAQNCSGGLTMTKAPERRNASWENNVKAAQLADQARCATRLPRMARLGLREPQHAHSH